MGDRLIPFEGLIHGVTDIFIGSRVNHDCRHCLFLTVKSLIMKSFAGSNRTGKPPASLRKRDGLAGSVSSPDRVPFAILGDLRELIKTGVDAGCATNL